MSNKYFTAPSEAVMVYPSGREVCNLKSRAGKREYVLRIASMLMRQNGVCCLCSRPLRLSGATFEHQDGRGMGGGNHDDRIMKDGKEYNGAACWACNGNKGSKRIDYN